MHRRGLLIVCLLSPLAALAAPPKAPKPPSLSSDEIKATVDSHLDKVKVCLNQSPDTSGKLVVGFTINAAGKPTELQAKEHSSNPTLDACVVQAFNDITFPKPRGGVPINVLYPFAFAPPPPPPKVGKLAPAQVIAVMRSKQAEVDACYKQHTADAPGLKGVTEVGVVVSPAGTVSEASVQKSTTNNAKLDACVVERIKTWTFPKPSDDGEAAILLPFSFSAPATPPPAKPAPPAKP